MKITYIKLENFIGIYAGTGRKILEIDFEKKNSNKIIMLLEKMVLVKQYYYHL